MQCDRAQEQFSDYIEGSLTPAMRLVFEQHLTTCAPCSSDIEQLREAYSLFAVPMLEVEPPAGFRAAVLNAIREQPARETVLSRMRTFLVPRGAPGLRRGPAAIAMATVLVGILGTTTWLTRHNIQLNSKGPDAVASIVPWGRNRVRVQNQNGILQGVTVQQYGGKTWHVFGMHLPDRVGQPVTAQSYVIQSAAALTDYNALQNSDNATAAPSVSVVPGSGAELPIHVTSDIPAGSSMTLLTTWRDATGDHKEVCIAPLSSLPPNAASSVNAGETLYQALEAAAVAYQTPIMINDTAVNQLNQPILQGLDGTDVDLNDSLADIVIPLNLTFVRQRDGSYVIDAV